MSGERKEGTYFAVWNMVRKGAGSLTAVIVGFVLQYVGFEPNATQSETTQEALRLMFSVFPAACYLIGAGLFLSFAFNEKEHQAIRSALEK